VHKNELSLAIVIPAYNEQRHLAACLKSIARQTVPPDEVIVVDNNSTDRTAIIAKKYPFVKVIKEPVQGLIAARNTGFAAAKSDLLARINADVRLAPNWVELVHADFAARPIMGLTGLASTKLLPSTAYGSTTIWTLMYFWMSEAFFGTGILWGANMVITAESWEQIRPLAHRQDALVHEDQDISLLLAGKGYRVFRDNRLLVATDEESYRYWPKLFEYLRRRWRTKSVHKLLGTYNSPQLIKLWPVRRIFSQVIALPASFIFVGYSLGGYYLAKLYHLVLRSRV
jgi:glycosyltransferase involved in cell wall biosynthesis